MGRGAAGDLRSLFGDDGVGAVAVGREWRVALSPSWLDPCRAPVAGQRWRCMALGPPVANLSTIPVAALHRCDRCGSEWPAAHEQACGPRTPTMGLCRGPGAVARANVLAHLLSTPFSFSLPPTTPFRDDIAHRRRRTRPKAALPSPLSLATASLERRRRPSGCSTYAPSGCCFCPISPRPRRRFAAPARRG